MRFAARAACDCITDHLEVVRRRRNCQRLPSGRLHIGRCVNGRSGFDLSALLVATGRLKASIDPAGRHLWRAYSDKAVPTPNAVRGPLVCWRFDNPGLVIDEVAARASSDFVGLVIDLVGSIFFLGLMIYFDPFLAMLVLALAIAIIITMRILSTLRADQKRQLRKEQTLLYGIGAFGLRNIDNIRATSAGEGFSKRLTGNQTRELAARQRFAELGHITGALPRLTIMLGAALVLGVGGWRVVSGELSIGDLMGFYMVAAMFLTTVETFVQFADAFQISESDMQRVNDAMSAGDDAGLGSQTEIAAGHIATLNGKLRLVGKIELRHVTFGFSANRPPLIKNFNLTTEQGQRIATIGLTGSGKSTLLRHANGYYIP